LVNSYIPSILNKAQVETSVKDFIIEEDNIFSKETIFNMNMLDNSKLVFPNKLLSMRYVFWSEYYGIDSYKLLEMTCNTKYMLTTVHKPQNLLDVNISKYFNKIYKNISYYISYLMGEIETIPTNIINTGLNVIDSYSKIYKGKKLLDKLTPEFVGDNRIFSADDIANELDEIKAAYKQISEQTRQIKYNKRTKVHDNVQTLKGALTKLKTRYIKG
jgi:hypothetical protein